MDRSWDECDGIDMLCWAVVLDILDLAQKCRFEPVQRSLPSFIRMWTDGRDGVGEIPYEEGVVGSMPFEP